ncbi:hypothetical protein THICB1_50186 [Thiomonas arsenitoxydans]|uniref:Transposase n=1 Tax=Thiomonas arsenitoxydans (strain DSM 22701 / CIP 110005 / 3As) TaxID=426114 RepID=A0ABP1Z586_THIA3|nr:hypothetical protein THICB1_50186 [Thiomonas arsenitoxydans]
MRFTAIGCARYPNQCDGLTQRSQLEDAGRWHQDVQLPAGRERVDLTMLLQVPQKPCALLGRTVTMKQLFVLVCPVTRAASLRQGCGASVWGAH